MAKIHKSAMVNLNSSKPVILDLPELAAGLRERMCARTDTVPPETVIANEIAEIMAEAEAEAAGIRANAASQAEQIVAAARQNAVQIENAAYQEGLAAGRIQAENQLDSHKSQLRESFDSQVDQLQQANRRLFDAMEPEILELTLQIAEKVLNLELSRNDSAFLGLVSSAMSHFKQGDKLNIQVSKNDYWRSIVSSAYAVNGSAQGLTVMADESLPDGSCIVESPAGAVDASLLTQMDHIRAALQDVCQEAGQ